MTVGISGPPAVARNADGRLAVFVVGGDGALWYVEQPTFNDGWGGWRSLGGDFRGLPIGAPSVVRGVGGELEVFAIDSRGQVQRQAQTAPGGAWGGWKNLGGGTFSGGPTAVVNVDGRLFVFAVTSERLSARVWFTYQTVLGSDDWSEWLEMGPPANWWQPRAVVRNADGRLEVFVSTFPATTGAVSGLWHTWQLAVNDGWSAGEWLGDVVYVVSAPSAVVNADGRLEVFVVDVDELWHIWQPSYNDGWSAGERLGGGPFRTKPSAVVNADGRLEVFLADDAPHASGPMLWHIWQPTFNDGWSGWEALGFNLAHPAAIVNADGRLEVFGMDYSRSGPLWHVWQPSFNDGWSNAENLGTP